MRTIQSACLVAAMLTVPLVAQEKPAPASTPGQPQVTVSVIDTAAPPEWELSVPLDATVGGNASVGSLSVRLIYPSTPLTFIQVRPTDKLKAAGFGVKASAPRKVTETPPTPAAKAAKDEKPQESSAITLTFTPDGPAPRPLPSGRLAILVFKVGKDAEEKSYDVWTDSVQAQGASSKEAVTAAAGKPAIFIVTPPGLPILSCFFYMH